MRLLKTLMLKNKDINQVLRRYSISDFYYMNRGNLFILIENN
jgi:hypothetical protein